MWGLLLGEVTLCYPSAGESEVKGWEAYYWHSAFCRCYICSALQLIQLNLLRSLAKGCPLSGL